MLIYNHVFNTKRKVHRDFVFNIHYSINREEVNAYCSDILEHGILQWLKCPLVPDSCITGSIDDKVLFIIMEAPYECELEEFVDHLHVSYPIKIELRPYECVQLSIPYEIIHENLESIKSCIHSLLENSKLYSFYKYCTFFRTHISVKLINEKIYSLLNEELYSHALFLTKDDIWQATMQFIGSFKEPMKIGKLKFGNTFENFINIYTEYDNVSLETTRDKVHKLFNKNKYDHPNRFSNSVVSFAETKSFREYKMSPKVSNFINGKIFRIKKFKNLFKIHWNQTNFHEHVTCISIDKRERFCILDEENFYKAILFICETFGECCFEERLFQLKYYINNSQWDVFENLLSILTNMQMEYIPLGKSLFEYAFELEEDKMNTVLQILYNFYLTIESRDVIAVNSLLFDILMATSCEGLTKDDILEKLFQYSYKAKLPECNLYAAELCGLKYGDKFETDILEKGLDILFMEVAKIFRQVKLEKNI